MTKRYYSRNKNGVDEFFAELLDEPILDSMWLRFSFQPQFILTSHMERLIRCIEERIVNEPLRVHFIQRLFDLIKKVPGIEQLYFPISVLDANGRLLEDNYRTQKELATEWLPEIFKPFTEDDGLKFEYLAPYLFFASQKNDANTISRNLFEEQINRNEDLQSSYASLVDSTAKYFVEWCEDNGNKYGLYWMTISDKTALFFVGSHYRHREIIFIG